MSQRLYRALNLIGEPGIRDPAQPPQRNAPSPLPTFLRFIGSRLNLLQPPPKADAVTAAFRQRLNAGLGKLADQPAQCDWFDLQAAGQDWLDTGIDLAAGERLTLMADGRLYVSRPLDVAIGANCGLWYRIGDADIRRLPAAGAEIQAEAAGRLRLNAMVPGGFADPQGGFDPDLPSLPLSGHLAVAVIRWQGDAGAALQAAATADAELFGPVLRRLQAPVQAPAGWQYLWRIGQGEIFHSQSGTQELCCSTHADAGILQYPLDLPLSDDLQFHWSWYVEQLPSALPEHIQPTHDYLSIAIEFDNGLDLTYMWSSELPVDTIFQCPLPWWDQRETHWVLRNRRADLGQWLEEQRCVKADCQRAIGGPLPERVVGVWLIANSAFQRGRGDCRYRDIGLASGGQKYPVLV